MPKKFAEKIRTNSKSEDRLENRLNALFRRLYSRSYHDGVDAYGYEISGHISVGSMANHPRDKLEELVRGYADRAIALRNKNSPRRARFPDQEVAEVLHKAGLKNVYWHVATEIKEDVDSIVEDLAKPKSRSGRG